MVKFFDYSSMLFFLALLAMFPMVFYIVTVLKKRQKSLREALGWPFSVIVCSLLFSFTLQLYARINIFDYIDLALNNSDSIVVINGAPVSAEMREQLGYAFANRKQTKQRGSHPTDSNTLTISFNEKKLTLLLDKDSREPDLYWVFLQDSVVSSDITLIKLKM